MTAVGLLALGLGAMLLWAAIRGDDPREILAGVIRPGSGKRSGGTMPGGGVQNRAI